MDLLRSERARAQRTHFQGDSRWNLRGENRAKAMERQREAAEAKLVQIQVIFDVVVAVFSYLSIAPRERGNERE